MAPEVKKVIMEGKMALKLELEAKELGKKHLPKLEKEPAVKSS